MKKIFTVLLIAAIVLSALLTLLRTGDTEPQKLDLLRARFAKKDHAAVDHSKFAQLAGQFKSPQDVTKACITCHNGQAAEIMASNHWNWERPEYIKGRGIVYLGKKNALNNFCIGVEGNEQSCAKCHIGYGANESAAFTSTDSTNIDCLICHDNTETYLKGNEMTGNPAAGIDLGNIARHIGKPRRSNCGVCHFFGGGGNNVKHGDLEKSMFEPSREIDAHMAVEGSNLQCIDCHVTRHHNISGKMYSLSSMNRNRVECEQCHTANPHEDGILNKHSMKVSCQACHINTYAKANATKTKWDWQTAGSLHNGEPYEIDDKDGNHTYLSIKGSFTWAKNLKPDYIWFNGTASHYLLGDKISDTSAPLILNTLGGNYSDRDSKITPVKIHTARQPYDPVLKILIQPKLFAKEKGKGAFWKDFNWKSASAEGMKDAHMPFSGSVAFINTKMYWPVNHMVATKDKAVTCIECHNSQNSRLAGLNDFYMPARDHNNLIETLGGLLILFSVLAVIFHGGTRLYLNYSKRKVVSK